MNIRSAKRLLLVVISGMVISSFLSAPFVYASDITFTSPLLHVSNSAKFVPGQVIVKYKQGHSFDTLNRARQHLAVSEQLPRENMSLLSITDNQTVSDTVKTLQNDPSVEYAEPNYTRDVTSISTNDTYKGLLWGLDNTGQDINGDFGDIAGTSGADIAAPEAWAINEGTNATPIVAVIDDGVSYTHPDLTANMWDGTNCKDNTGAALGGCNHGYDYQSNDKTPLPVGSNNYHGTHVAGIIGAVKNNGIGVMGVAPHVQIMAIRFALDVATEVKSIDFAIANGAKVINASFGGGGYSQAEFDAISRFKDAGGIFVAAAGNDAVSNDTTPFYPAGYNLPNIISVAATDQNDALASFSNYGPTTVDVAAPGENILSTITGNAYGYLSGTSMATPYTVGLAALIWGYKPSLTATQVKNIILSSGDQESTLAGETVSGKRINAQKALFDADIISTQAIHDAAVVGTDPGDYSSGAVSDLQTAIDAATVVLGNSGSTDSDITTGVTNLDTATATFNATVVPADLTALTAAIASAQTLHDGATEGVVPGNYIVGSKAILQSAIDAASAVTSSATQTQVNAALATLNTTVSTFNASIVPPSDLTALTAEIATATTLVTSVVEGTSPGQYPVGSKATLQTAITTAQAITNTVSQGTVNSALVTLTTAISVFQNGIVGATITASSDSHGSITPTGAVSVAYGVSQTFTITANSGYTIDTVTVDGTSAGTISTYSFSNVITNHTISATFTAIPVSSGGGGGGGGGGGASPATPSVNTSTVTASPLPGTYAKSQVVTLTSSINNTIHFRMDGGSVSCSTGYVYSSPLAVTQTSTIQAVACNYSGIMSTPVSFMYTIDPSVTSNSSSDVNYPRNLVTTSTPLSSSTGLTFTHTLRIGMTSNDVLIMQKYFNAHGFVITTSGIGSPGLEGTHFGQRTLLAVKAFQKANGLKTDGVVGPKTASLMK